jgi:hypothetical protein
LTDSGECLLLQGRQARCPKVKEQCLQQQSTPYFHKVMKPLSKSLEFSVDVVPQRLSLKSRGVEVEIMVGV